MIARLSASEPALLAACSISLSFAPDKYLYQNPCKK